MGGIVIPAGFFVPTRTFSLYTLHFLTITYPAFGSAFVKILEKSPLKTASNVPFYHFLARFRYLVKYITIAFLCLLTPEQIYSQDSISFKQLTDNTIPVPSKMDLTKLPRGEIFKVTHRDFTLQFFFNNNRDIFGYIFKRKPDTGIMAHLCLYRTCEVSPYDLRNVIAKPFEPPYDKTFFSIRFPQKLQYDFQGLEFLPHK